MRNFIQEFILFVNKIKLHRRSKLLIFKDIPMTSYQLLAFAVLIMGKRGKKPNMNNQKPPHTPIRHISFCSHSILYSCLKDDHSGR